MLEKKNFYINGTWTAPKNKQNIEVINPATEKACAVISLGGKEDIHDAVVAAKEAFNSWGFSTKEERIELLEKLYVLYKKRWNDISEAITLEMGAPKDFSTKLQTGTGASHIKSFIRYLKDFEFERGLGDHAKNQRILYEPKGVCALITPWNWPINQVCLKVIPALAAGCTMVLKPSELAPLSAIIIAELIDEAGFPKGVFNLVNEDWSFITGYMEVAANWILIRENVMDLTHIAFLHKNTFKQDDWITAPDTYWEGESICYEQEFDLAPLSPLFCAGMGLPEDKPIKRIQKGTMPSLAISFSDWKVHDPKPEKGRRSDFIMRGCHKIGRAHV